MLHLVRQTRRHFLQTSSLGLGALALAQMSARAKPAGDPMDPRQPHFAPKVKNVIVLHMSGAPPHLDMLDYKPELVKHNGEPCPDSLIKGKRFAFTSGVPKLLGTYQKFARHGQCGMELSEALPQLSSI